MPGILDLLLALARPPQYRGTECSSRGRERARSYAATSALALMLLGCDSVRDRLCSPLPRALSLSSSSSSDDRLRIPPDPGDIDTIDGEYVPSTRARFGGDGPRCPASIVASASAPSHSHPNPRRGSFKV